MGGSAAAVMTRPAFRKIEWLARDIAVERRPDGVIVLKSRIPLQPSRLALRAPGMTISLSIINPGNTP
jgi:hypothetical protein